MEKKKPKSARRISRQMAKKPEEQGASSSPNASKKASSPHKATMKIPSIVSQPAKVQSLQPASVQNRALSIRQPYAELILRGEKKIEYRSMRTNIRGRVYVYASLTPVLDVFENMGAKPGDFPTGVLVGTVEIVDCTGSDSDYEWHLARPERLAQPIPPQRHPQPSWFIPFLEKSPSRDIR